MEIVPPWSSARSEREKMWERYLEFPSLVRGGTVKPTGSKTAGSTPTGGISRST